MKKTNTHLQHKIKPLGTESSGFAAEPISNIKYNKYAYKIDFKQDQDTSEIAHICEQAFEDEFITFRHVIYIASYSDYCLALMLFEKRIERVSGPVNSDHVDILLSKYVCVIRPNNWYRLYDCKMDVYFSMNARQNYKTLVADLESLIEPPFKMVKSSFWHVCVYNTFEQARVTEAMCKLTYPRETLRMYITRCLVYRK